MKPSSRSLFIKASLCFIAIALFSCGKNAPERIGPPNTSSGIQAFKNVQYGFNKGLDGKNVDLGLDVYVPAYSNAAEKFPLVLFVHGGGFITGDKSGSGSSMQQFAKSGFVGVSVNYRLNTTADENNMCDIPVSTTNKSVYMAVQDTRAALRFMVANADKYHIDTSRIFLSGNSAGAVTVLNAHFLTQLDFEEMIPGVKVKLGGLDNADNNLTNTYAIRAIAANSGCLNDTKYINALNLVPVIFFHGEEDSVIPIDSGRTYSCINTQLVYGSRTLYQNLTQLGVSTVLHVDPSGGHLSFGENFTNSEEVCFFNSVMSKISESGIYMGQESSCQ